MAVQRGAFEVVFASTRTAVHLFRIETASRTFPMMKVLAESRTKFNEDNK